jgi:hypothetical protein
MLKAMANPRIPAREREGDIRLPFYDISYLPRGAGSRNGTVCDEGAPGASRGNWVVGSVDGVS